MVGLEAVMGYTSGHLFVEGQDNDDVKIDVQYDNKGDVDDGNVDLDCDDLIMVIINSPSIVKEWPML